mmetsp:Transcript_43795/g.68570  ORF Transcript_43795/g.68570 Transcript_43795/m.68570 type:complete len:200 (+) Transcript_43795:776-1375(+)
MAESLRISTTELSLHSGRSRGPMMTSTALRPVKPPRSSLLHVKGSESSIASVLAKGLSSKSALVSRLASVFGGLGAQSINFDWACLARPKKLHRCWLEWPRGTKSPLACIRTPERRLWEASSANSWPQPLEDLPSSWTVEPTHSQASTSSSSQHLSISVVRSQSLPSGQPYTSAHQQLSHFLQDQKAPTRLRFRWTHSN